MVVLLCIAVTAGGLLVGVWISSAIAEHVRREK